MEQANCGPLPRGQAGSPVLISRGTVSMRAVGHGAGWDGSACCVPGLIPEGPELRRKVLGFCPLSFGKGRTVSSKSLGREKQIPVLFFPTAGHEERWTEEGREATAVDVTRSDRKAQGAEGQENTWAGERARGQILRTRWLVAYQD